MTEQGPGNPTGQNSDKPIYEVPLGFLFPDSRLSEERRNKKILRNVNAIVDHVYEGFVPLTLDDLSIIGTNTFAWVQVTGERVRDLNVRLSRREIVVERLRHEHLVEIGISE